MQTKTYFCHVDTQGNPSGPRLRYLGTPHYGYATLAMAVRFCRNNDTVEERHHNANDDWTGRLMGWRDADGFYYVIQH